MQTGAMNLNTLWAGRWLAGLGVGFLVMIVPIYQCVSPGLLPRTPSILSSPICSNGVRIRLNTFVSNFDN